MDVIYCAGGGKVLAEIALAEGFLYGARSDDIRPEPRCNGLIDINWKEYDWVEHVKAVKQHKPKYAVVPDITRIVDYNLAIEYAEEIEDYCGYVIIVPKIPGIIKNIPQKYVIGVSIPTSYSGFIPSVRELSRHKVHLLGGSPGQQKEMWKYYQRMNVTVCSVDINCHNKTSNFGNYWNGYKWDFDGIHQIDKYEAFKRSCVGIMEMWADLGAI